MKLNRKRENREEMPSENCDQLARGAGKVIPEPGEARRGSEPDPRNRELTTLIPLPRTGQFSLVSQNQKIAKTEKNRLQLIMDENRGGGTDDIHDKEERINVRKVSRDNSRVSADYFAIMRSCEESSERRRNRKVKLN